MNPDRVGLTRCVSALSEFLGTEPLSSDAVGQLIDYVLFSGSLGGAEGKNGRLAFENGLITKDECIDLVIAHAFTWLRAHDAGTPSDSIPLELRARFEASIFGTGLHE